MHLEDCRTKAISEPVLRFIQRESFEPQANEIPNTMPSWLPSNDYLINFRKGDPYTKIDDGYARLPGAGYAALHPELKGMNPERYPDIYKLRILSDVAPYSREYNLYRQKVAGEARHNTALEIELDKIMDRVRQVNESSIQMDHRRFTAPVDTIEGTVKEAGPGGVTLKEYPGRVFRFSSVGLSAADISARVLGENNQVPPSCRPQKTSRARAARAAPESGASPSLAPSAVASAASMGTRAARRCPGRLKSWFDFAYQDGWGNTFPLRSLDTFGVSSEKHRCG